jgi:hypothetical protein
MGCGGDAGRTPNSGVTAFHGKGTRRRVSVRFDEQPCRIGLRVRYCAIASPTTGRAITFA